MRKNELTLFPRRLSAGIRGFLRCRRLTDGRGKDHKGLALDHREGALRYGVGLFGQQRAHALGCEQRPLLLLSAVLPHGKAASGAPLAAIIGLGILQHVAFAQRTLAQGNLGRRGVMGAGFLREGNFGVLLSRFAHEIHHQAADPLHESLGIGLAAADFRPAPFPSGR